jgi:GH25 family lysozyme M1 (1,4-beta-N-acetylmuramidase)
MLGTDWSHWQGYSSVEKAKEAGIDFWFFKASEGTGYVDTKFESFRKQAEDLKVPWGPYHFFRPNYSPTIQAQHFYKVVGEYKGLPPVVDFETSAGLTKDTVNKRALDFVSQVKSFFGRPPIIYTRGYFWNYWMYPSDYWKQFPLWVAHYGASSPYLPREWDDYTFWQYSETGDGSKYGVASTYVDLNKTTLSKEELYKMAGLSGEYEVFLPVVTKDSKGCLPMVCNARYLNVRNKPSIFGSKVKHLVNGEKVDVYALDYGSSLVWAKISDTEEMWCAAKYLRMQ